MSEGFQSGPVLYAVYLTKSFAFTETIHLRKKMYFGNQCMLLFVRMVIRWFHRLDAADPVIFVEYSYRNRDS